MFNKIWTFIIYAFFILGSIIFGFLGLGALVIPGHQTFGFISLGIACFTFFTAIFQIHRSQTINSRKREKEKKERKILKAIESNNGQVTPIEIASQTGISCDEAKSLLDELVDKGNGRTLINEKGTLTYVFDALISKTTQKDPFEFNKISKNKHSNREREI